MPTLSSFIPPHVASTLGLIEDGFRRVVSAAEGPVGFAISAVALPIDVATSSLHIFRLTEELLEEVVFLLRSMRPVVEAVSTAQQSDHFDSVYRTLDQIQHSADALTRAPIGVVRNVLGPVRSRSEVVEVPRVVEAEHMLRTPTVEVRIASMTLSVPSIAVGKARPPVRPPL